MIRRLTIRTKDSTLERFQPNWAQKLLLDRIQEQRDAGKPVRIIILKARQLGMSTASGGILFCESFVYNHRYSLVIAHENEASEYLLSMYHTFWEEFPYKEIYTPKYVSRRELAWKETGSSIRIATARNVRSGRGRTINALHGSEVAFWERPEEVMLGMRQAIPNRPGTTIILESTANGVGNWFYDTWHAAVAGDIEYVPIFLSWWQHPDYTASAAGIRVDLGILDPDEAVLRRMGVDDDHLEWRRWAIRNLCDGSVDMFHQEYPSSPEEAFLSTGSNVFPIEKLGMCFEPLDGVRGFLIRDGDQVRFSPDRTGPLRIFRQPSKDKDWGSYFIGGDPTHTTRGDAACAQVINRRTYEQVAVWHGRTDPMSFAEELAKLGRFYNTAWVAPENEGPGYATIGRLMEMDYPHIWRKREPDNTPGKIAEKYGWSTSAKRKEWAIGWLIKLIVDQDLTIHDRRTFDELRNYVTLPAGGYGPADATHGYDDCVMALAIACICSNSDGPLMAYEARSEERDFKEPIPTWEDWGEAS